MSIPTKLTKSKFFTVRMWREAYAKAMVNANKKGFLNRKRQKQIFGEYNT